jgi:hypothetical protein
MPNEEMAPDSDRTTLMLAYLCIKDLSALSEQIAVLDRFGFTSLQIAAICGVAEGSVRNARMQSKKVKPTGRRKASRSKEE